MVNYCNYVIQLITQYNNQFISHNEYCRCTYEFKYIYPRFNNSIKPSSISYKMNSYDKMNIICKWRNSLAICKKKKELNYIKKIQSNYIVQSLQHLPIDISKLIMQYTHILYCEKCNRHIANPTTDICPDCEYVYKDINNELEVKKFFMSTCNDCKEFYVYNVGHRTCKCYEMYFNK